MPGTVTKRIAGKLALLLLTTSMAAQTVLQPAQGGTGKSGASLVHNIASSLVCSDSSGSGTAQSCTTSPSFTPAAKDWIIYSTTTPNGGDLTINVNSLGAKHVRKWLGTAVLDAGDLPAGVAVPLYYDGTYWEIPVIGNAPGGLTYPGAGVVCSTGSAWCTSWALSTFGNSTTSSPSTLTDGSTVTWAIASAFNANASLTFTTHGGSRTLNLTGLVAGGNYTLTVVQDSSGTNEGLTLGSGCTWKVAGGGLGTVVTTTGVSAVDVLSIYYDGTNCYANFGTNFN